MSLNVVSRRASWPQHAVRAGAVQPQGVLPRGPPPHTLPDLHQHWRLPPDRRRPRGSLCLRIWWSEHTPSYGRVFIQTGSWLRRSCGVDHSPCYSSLMWRGSWVMEGICWFGLCFGGWGRGGGGGCLTGSQCSSLCCCCVHLHRPMRLGEKCLCNSLCL